MTIKLEGAKEIMKALVDYTPEQYMRDLPDHVLREHVAEVLKARGNEFMTWIQEAGIIYGWSEMPQDLAPLCAIFRARYGEGPIEVDLAADGSFYIEPFQE